MQAPTKTLVTWDSVPAWIIKSCVHELSTATTNTCIVNTCIKSPSFQSKLKKCTSCPFSISDNGMLKNFRPVLNRKLIWKTEKVHASRINDHLSEFCWCCWVCVSRSFRPVPAPFNQALTGYGANHPSEYLPFQSAYRSGHSIETALLIVQNDFTVVVCHSAFVGSQCYLRCGLPWYSPAEDGNHLWGKGISY